MLQEFKIMKNDSNLSLALTDELECVYECSRGWSGHAVRRGDYDSAGLHLRLCMAEVIGTCGSHHHIRAVHLGHIGSIHSWICCSDQGGYVRDECSGGRSPGHTTDGLTRQSAGHAAS